MLRKLKKNLVRNQKLVKRDIQNFALCAHCVHGIPFQEGKIVLFHRAIDWRLYFRQKPTEFQAWQPVGRGGGQLWYLTRSA